MTDSADQPPRLDRWRAWNPAQVALLLGGVDVPWYIAGGWALSLHCGTQLREHDDIEVGVPADRFVELLPALEGFELYVPSDAGTVRMLDAGHELLATHHQTWLREPATDLWRMDFFREPTCKGNWECRRDPAITLPYDQLIRRTADGVPYACPQVVLLFKAKAARAKDDADLAATLPQMTHTERSWLADAIARVHGEHRWVAQITPQG